jgi:hypothetical protein
VSVAVPANSWIMRDLRPAIDQFAAPTARLRVLFVLVVLLAHPVQTLASAIQNRRSIVRSRGRGAVRL